MRGDAGNMDGMLNLTLFKESQETALEDFSEEPEEGKGPVIRATKSLNLVRNIVSLQVTERMLLVLPP